MLTNKSKINILKLTTMAMLVAISVASLFVVRFPLIPSAAFLEYDAADIPILICTLMFGPIEGLITLLITCIIQGVTVSAESGWIGMLMHFCASGALVVLTGVIYKATGKKFWGMIVGLVSGAIAMIALMIPLNLIFTTMMYNLEVSVVKGMLLPAIIPFNAIKAGINAAVVGILFPIINKAIKAIGIRRELNSVDNNSKE